MAMFSPSKRNAKIVRTFKSVCTTSRPSSGHSKLRYGQICGVSLALAANSLIEPAKTCIHRPPIVCLYSLPTTLTLKL